MQTQDQISDTTTPPEKEDYDTYQPDPSEERFIAAKLGVDRELEQVVEDGIETFQTSLSRYAEQYLQQANQRKAVPDNCLEILNGWNNALAKSFTAENPGEILLSNRAPRGGFFIRWNGKGVVVNPGKGFLGHFHRKGFSVLDIDFVVVTREEGEAYSDVEKIYNLNYQLNKINPELQVIRYYLNQKAYRNLSHILKPNFKQERDTIHSLELFVDSPDVESINPGSGIELNYFSTATDPNSSGQFTLSNPGNLGLRLDLGNEGGKKLRIAYLSGLEWSPLLAHNLGKCDLLISGFGATNASDYGKLNYNENSLGYYGTFSLLEEVGPKLALCTEFDGKDGDLRLDIVKKMRKEIAPGENQSAILPGDLGLSLDLATLQVKCSITGQLAPAEEIQVMKTAENFGELHYVAPKSRI